MVENRSRSNSRMIAGLILVIIGALFLLDNLNFLYFNLPHVIFSFPAILIIIGLLILANSEKKGFGIILVVVGTVWILPRIFPWIYINGGVIFSVLIIALGIYILTKRRRWTTHHYKNYKEMNGSQPNATEQKEGYSANIDRLDDVSIFGGGQKFITSNNFQGGNVTAIFGGSEIDLTRCKLSPGKNVLEVVAIFGGTTLILPKEWNVIIDVLPLFGGFSHKGMRGPNVVTDPESTLIIKGVVILGGGEVKTL
jgi:predicted membrane protein